MKIIGKVHQIGNLQTIQSKSGGQPFTKRELILDATRFDGLTGERGFENYPAFEFGGERCSELDRFKVGDVVEVSFDLQGSFYKGSDGVEKNFTRIRGYKVEYYGKKPVSTHQHAQSESTSRPPQPSEADIPAPEEIPPMQPSGGLPW